MGILVREELVIGVSSKASSRLLGPMREDLGKPALGFCLRALLPHMSGTRNSFCSREEVGNSAVLAELLKRKFFFLTSFVLDLNGRADSVGGEPDEIFRGAAE